MSVKSEEQDVKKIVTAVFKRGWYVSLVDVDNTILVPACRDIDKIENVLSDIEEGVLRIFRKERTALRVGWIYIVFGGGNDCVVSDYSDNADIRSLLAEVE